MKESSPSFELDVNQERSARLFRKEHHEKHKDENQGAIGGAITYSFTPTAIGTIIKISCYCGESEDLTSYDNW